MIEEKKNNVFNQRTVRKLRNHNWGWRVQINNLFPWRRLTRFLIADNLTFKLEDLKIPESTLGVSKNERGKRKPSRFVTKNLILAKGWREVWALEFIPRNITLRETLLSYFIPNRFIFPRTFPTTLYDFLFLTGNWITLLHRDKTSWVVSGFHFHFTKAKTQTKACECWSPFYTETRDGRMSNTPMSLGGISFTRSEGFIH